MAGCFGNSTEDKIKEMISLGDFRDYGDETDICICENCGKDYNWKDSKAKFNSDFCSNDCQKDASQFLYKLGEN